jgi:hypothetical protein
VTTDKVDVRRDLERNMTDKFESLKKEIRETRESHPMQVSELLRYLEAKKERGVEPSSEA